MSLPELPIPTLAEHVDTLWQALPANFPIQNRDPFSRWGTLVALAAQAGIDARVFTAGLLPVGFATEATGDWLDLHAAGLSLTRIEASNTEGEVRFITAGSGVVPAGTVVQTNSGSGDELRYLVVDDTEIAAPSTLVLVRAEQPGSRYNVGAGRITTLVTLLPFVQDVTNDEGWITSGGVDRETDELLRQRILLRFPAAGAGTTYHAYILQAREVPGIVKVRVMDQHPRGQGTVDVIVAPVRGAPTVEQIAAAQALVEARRPVTADVLVKAPTLQPADVAVTLYPRTGVTTTPQVWQARIQAVIDSLGIGDALYPSSIVKALMDTGELLGVQMVGDDAPIPALSETHLITAGQISTAVEAAP